MQYSVCLFCGFPKFQCPVEWKSYLTKLSRSTEDNVNAHTIRNQKDFNHIAVKSYKLMNLPTCTCTQQQSFGHDTGYKRNQLSCTKSRHHRSEPTSKSCFVISLQSQLLQIGKFKLKKINKFKTNLNSRAFSKTYHWCAFD